MGVEAGTGNIQFDQTIKRQETRVLKARFLFHSLISIFARILKKEIKYERVKTALYSKIYVLYSLLCAPACVL